MILLRLAGGIGNQLFQLCYAINLSNQNESIFVLGDALRLYKSAREPDFLRFFLNQANLTYVPKSNFFVNLLVVHGRVGRYFPVFGINDSNYNSKNILSLFLRRKVPIKVLDGYFQQHLTDANIRKFFESISIFPLQEAAVSHIYSYLLAKYECCIHVRGGDFLLPQNQKFNICREKYYLLSVDRCVSMGIRRFLVLSDDISASKELIALLSKAFTSAEFEVHSASLSAVDELLLIASFPHKIISNSTFAWWGSCLSSFFCNESLSICPGLFDSSSNAPSLPGRSITISPL